MVLILTPVFFKSYVTLTNDNVLFLIMTEKITRQLHSEWHLRSKSLPISQLFLVRVSFVLYTHMRKRQIRYKIESYSWHSIVRWIKILVSKCDWIRFCVKPLSSYLCWASEPFWIFFLACWTSGSELKIKLWRRLYMNFRVVKSEVYKKKLSILISANR